MLRWFLNLRLGYKILMPLVILFVTIGAIVWVAQSGINGMRADTALVARTLSERRAAGLSMIANVNDAAIQEKTILVDPDEGKAKGYLDRFNQRMDRALADADELIALADTPERVAINQKLKNDILGYRRLAGRSIELSSRHENEAAKQFSVTEVVAARRAFVADNDGLIERRNLETKKALADTVELGDHTLLKLYTLAGVGLALSVGLLAVVIVGLIVRPLSALIRSVQRLTAGDLRRNTKGQASG